MTTKSIHSILLIDDEEADHVISKYTIAEYDPSIQVFSAYDGQEALDFLATHNAHIDIVLLDINMPGMDGHDFLHHYAQVDSPVSVVVMLTSSNQMSDKLKCGRYAFVREYYSKPLELAMLQSITDILNTPLPKTPEP